MWCACDGTARYKRLSRTALALAEQSRRLSLHDAAARLLDISGDDARLSWYLNSHVRPSSAAKDNGPISNSNGSGGGVGLSYLGGADAPGASSVSVETWLKALESAAAKTGRRGWGGTEVATGTDTEMKEVTGDWDAGVLFRRPTLLAGMPPLVPRVSSGKAAVTLLHGMLSYF